MGTVRIWDATQREHNLKKEVKPVAGPIRDIAWDADSKRVLALGDGRQK
jgi:hypothetical protein